MLLLLLLFFVVVVLQQADLLLRARVSAERPECEGAERLPTRGRFGGAVPGRSLGED